MLRFTKQGNNGVFAARTLLLAAITRGGEIYRMTWVVFISYASLQSLCKSRKEVLQTEGPHAKVEA